MIEAISGRFNLKWLLFQSLMFLQSCLIVQYAPQTVFVTQLACFPLFTQKVAMPHKGQIKIWGQA